MVRLPDIPIESWVADQQELLSKKISGLFPALEFRDAASNVESDIPLDFPMYGGPDSFEQEQEYIRALEERQAREEEEARRRQQQALEEAQRQQALDQQRQMFEMQAQDDIAAAGIPTPQDAFASFQNAVGTAPGTGDPLSDTGAFDPDIQPFEQPAPADPYDFSSVQTPDDFMNYTNGLLNLEPEQATPAPTPIPDWRQETEREWTDQRSVQERLTDGLKPIVDQAGEILGWMKDTAVRGAQQSLPEGSPLRPPDDYGQVVSEPGEPDYVRPRAYGEATSTERRRMEDAQKAWEEARGILPSIGAGAEVVGAGADPVTARLDVVAVPALTKSGIMELDWTPEQRARVEELTRKLFEKSATPEDEAEFQRLHDQIDRRYEQIKDQPDQLMRYFQAAPGSVIVPLALGLGMGGYSGMIRSGASAAGRAAGLSDDAARGVGYAADLAAQSTVDPLNLPFQSGVDSLVEGARRGRQAIGEGLRYADRLAGRVWDDARGAVAGIDRALGLTDDAAEASDALSVRGIVPPEVRKRIVPEVELPRLRGQEDLLERAVENVGGFIDEDGVHLYVTRAYQPEHAGLLAYRNGVFLEPIPEGGRSSYLNPGGGIGGEESLPRTETLFRKPLVLSGGDDDHLENAFWTLGIRPNWTAKMKTILARAYQAELKEMDESFAGATNDVNAEYAAQSALRNIEERYQKIMASEGGVQDFEEAVHFLQNRFRDGSPKQVQAFQELMKSYGGDPDLVSELVNSRNLGTEGTWALKENVVANVARKQGHDGMLVVGPDGRSPYTVIEVMDFHLSHSPTPPPDEFRNPRLAEMREEIRRGEEELSRLQGDWGRFRDAMAEGGDRSAYTPEELTRMEDIQSRLDDLDEEWQQTPEWLPDAPRPGYRLHPDVDPDLRPFPNVQQRVTNVRGALPAQRLPLSQEGRPGTRRLFHGGRIGNEDIDPGRFDENGLYGPAHYLSTSPDVAEHYFHLSSNDMRGAGSVIRPADLDNKARLYDVTKPLPQSDLKRIVRALDDLYGDEPDMQDILTEYRMLADAPPGSVPRIDAQEFYDNLALELTDPADWRNLVADGVEAEAGNRRLVNEILSDAGFDGIYYRGERTNLHGAESTPQHSAVAIFGDKLDKLRNAFTGELRGISDGAEEGGEAVFQAQLSLPARRNVGTIIGAGMGAGQEDIDGETTPLDRVRNAALGAVFGRVGAQKGTLAAARLVDDLIAKGRVSSEVLERHPLTSERIRALFTLAAKNKADDEVVEVPGLVGVLMRMEPEVRAEITDLIDGPKTAGEIRRIVAETMTPESLGEQARILVIDMLAGTGVRAARRSESAADRATIEGVTPVRRWFERASTEKPADVIETPMGRATRMPEDGGTARFVGNVADSLGIQRPTVYMVNTREIGAWATSGTDGGAPKMILSAQLGKMDLTMDELAALVTHELAHTNEASFGERLLSGVGDLAERAVRNMGETPAPQYRGAAPNPRVPARGVWRDRVRNGVQIPEGASNRTAHAIQQKYDDAMRHLERSQTPRLKAKNQIRYLGDAHRAWAEYEELVTQAEKEAARAARRAPRADVPAREVADAPGTPREDVVRDPDRPLLDDEDPEPFGPGPRRPADQVPDTARDGVDQADAGRAVEPAFEPEPLPTEINPREVVSKDDAAKFLGQLEDDLALDKPTLDFVRSKSIELLRQPKIRMRHLQQMLEWVGERRATGRYGTKQEEAAQYADRFFKKNGWLADPDASAARPSADLADAGTPGVGRVPDAEAAAEPTPGDAGRLLDDLGDGAPADSELAEIEGSWDDLTMENFPGILGRSQENPRLASPADPRVKMYKDPKPLHAPRDLGIFERIHNAWRERFVTAWTDELAVLQGFQNDVAAEYRRQTGNPIPPELLAAEMKRLDPGRAAAQAINDRLKPALQTFKRLGVPMADAAAYLSYMHDIDVDVAKGGGRTFPAGTDAAHAQKFISDKITTIRNELGARGLVEFQDAVRQVQDFGDHLAQVLLDGQLIDQDTYNVLRQTYPHYVPTRIIQYIGDDTHVGVGKSLSVSSNTLHAMSEAGTDKEAMSPFAALISSTHQIYAAAHKNKVFNAMIDLYDEATTQVAARRIANQGPGQGSAVERRIEAVVDGIVFAGRTSQKTPEGWETLQGFRDGKKIKMMVSDQLGSLTKFPSPTVIPILSGLMSAFRSGATARNPVFLTANMLLDLSSFMIRESARAGGPQYIPQVLAVYAKTAAEFLPLQMFAGSALGAAAGSSQINEDDTMVSAAAKVLAGMAGGASVGTIGDATIGRRFANNTALRDIARHEYSGDMARFLREGGGTSGGFYERSARPPEDYNWKFKKFDVDDFLKKMGWRTESHAERNVKELTRDFIDVSNPREALRVLRDLALLKPVEAFGERIELVPRVAAMRLAENRGAGIVEAINAGRTTTIDFNKGGTWSKAINQIIPFFNVGTQAIADIGRAVQENPVGFPAAVLTTVLAPIAAAEFINRLDPQTSKDYDDVPDYIKDQGMVIMLPEKYFGPAPVDEQGNRRPQKFHFRYRQLAPVATLTREILDRWIFRPDMPEDERRSAAEAFFSAFAQLSPVSIQSSEDAAVSLLPPVAATAAQVGFNKDTFRGVRIVSEYADERASPMSKALAKNFGGRPSQWEFATRDIGTGYAGMLHGASEILAGKRKSAPQDTPISGGLYGRWVKGSQGGRANIATQNTYTKEVDKILSDAGVNWRPDKADPEIRNLPLNRQEYADYQFTLNREINKRIIEISKWPRFQNGTPAERKALIEEQLGPIRQYVRDQFMANLPNQAYQEKIKRNLEQGKPLPGRR